MTSEKIQIHYQALCRRDVQYDGIFFFGVGTTGVFCRPTCPARKPKLSNYQFFITTQQAQEAGFHPCLRCHPTELPDTSPLLSRVLEKLQGNPEHRCRTTDFQAIGTNESTIRRLFHSRFGMTFVAYARHLRLSRTLALRQQGEPVLTSQLEAGYEPSSGFRDSFSKLWDTSPKNSTHVKRLLTTWIDTPLGVTIEAADKERLHLLEFTNRKNLAKELSQLQTTQSALLIVGESMPLTLIREELADYFAGRLIQFRTPLTLGGTPFQQNVWRALIAVPYGTTTSYTNLAQILNRDNQCSQSARDRNSLPPYCKLRQADAWLQRRPRPKRMTHWFRGKTQVNETLKAIHAELLAQTQPKANEKITFFKTGAGQYAETDQFLNVRVPVLRQIAKEHKAMSRPNLQTLIDSPYNEERLLALLILNNQYKRAKGADKEDLYAFYIQNLSRVNNWNLVDASTRLILGEHLLTRDRSSLLALVQSVNLWERRVAMVATGQFIRANDFTWTIRLAQMLLDDKEDLIHKASGWMLREMGERDQIALVDFLDKWASRMPRTMLRYAIEKFPEDQRKTYLAIKKV